MKKKTEGANMITQDNQITQFKNRVERTVRFAKRGTQMNEVQSSQTQITKQVRYANELKHISDGYNRYRPIEGIVTRGERSGSRSGRLIREAIYMNRTKIEYEFRDSELSGSAVDIDLIRQQRLDESKKEFNK
jgi:hypothetical protein